jgi:hypothetical protein
MYLRTTQRRNRDGSVVRYYALAENVRHPTKGHVEAKVVHSFGRADRLDRAALERLVRSIRRVLDAGHGEGPGGRDGPRAGDRDRGELRARHRRRGRAAVGPARHRPGARRPAGG